MSSSSVYSNKYLEEGGGKKKAVFTILKENTATDVLHPPPGAASQNWYNNYMFSTCYTTHPSSSKRFDAYLECYLAFGASCIKPAQNDNMVHQRWTCCNSPDWNLRGSAQDSAFPGFRAPEPKPNPLFCRGLLPRDLPPQSIKLLSATSQNPERDNVWTNRFCSYLGKKAEQHLQSQLSRSTSLKCCSLCTEKHKFTTRDKESPELIVKVGSMSAGTRKNIFTTLSSILKRLNIKSISATLAEHGIRVHIQLHVVTSLVSTEKNPNLRPV